MFKSIVAVLILTMSTGFIVYKITGNRNPCKHWESIELDDIKVNNDRSITSNGITYHENEYYKDGDKLRGCTCIKNSCIRKCCPINQSYVSQEGKPKCLNTDNINFLHQLKYYDYITGDELKEVIHNDIRVVNHELQKYCKEERLTYAVLEHFLLANGSLLNYEVENVYKIITIQDYCVESLKGNVHFFMCAEPLDFDNVKQIILPVCMLMSLPFLVITFLVYYFIYDLHNLVGKSLLSLTFSKIVSYILLTLIQLKGQSIGRSSCTALGHVLQYSLAATFFWLNVMCFDMWLVFRVNRPKRLTKDEESKKFLKYAVYAWGTPALISIAIYVADNCLPPDSEYRPMIGERYCVINSENKSRWIFYFLPLTVLLILNLYMFLTTAFNIFQLKKQTAVLKGSGNHISNKKEKERLNLYFKLFLVMGITWAAEPISYLFNEKPEWLWISLDAVNLLLGIMVFVIFVCKRRTLSAINAQLCPSKSFFNMTTSVNSRDESKEIEAPPNYICSKTDGKNDKTSGSKTDQRNNLEMVPAENKY